MISSILIGNPYLYIINFLYWSNGYIDKQIYNIYHSHLFALILGIFSTLLPNYSF